MERNETSVGSRITVVAVGEMGAQVLRALPRLPCGETLPQLVNMVLVASDPMVLEASRCPSRLIMSPNHDAAVFEKVLGRPEAVVLVTSQGDAPLATVAARSARREQTLVVAIVAGGFASANPALAELECETDAVIEIPSGAAGAAIGCGAQGSSLDWIMASAVHGLIALLTHHGFIGWDLEDLRTVMRGPGRGRVGFGWGRGLHVGTEAARRAIASPMLAGVLLGDARAIFVPFIVGESVTLTDINEAATVIQEAAHEETNIVIAAVVETDNVDEMRVALYAIGQREGVT